MSFNHSFEQNLRRAARETPQVSLPAPLKARVMSMLPLGSTRKQRPLAVSFALAAVTIVAIVGMALLFQSPSQKIYAAEVQHAIRQTQTWHFSGWRLEQGKQVRWEVWGRRSPFFYREQLRDKIILDDGERRTYILPPSQAESRTHGIYLIQPTQAAQAQSQIDQKGKADQTAGLLAGLGAESRYFSELRLSADGTHLESTTEIQRTGIPLIAEFTTLQADKRTFLPTQYSVDRKEYARKMGDSLNIPAGAKPIRTYRHAELHAEYNIPLPANIEEKDKQTAYSVIDLTLPPPIAPNGRNVVSSNGLTVAAEIVGQDSAGNLHLQFQAWVGGRPYAYPDQQLDLEMPQYYANGFGITPHRAQDDGGNDYIDISSSITELRNPSRPSLWITPLEPVQGNAPQEITVNAWFQLSRYEDLGSHSVASVPVAKTEQMIFRLPIPKKTVDLHYDRQGGKPGQDYSGVPDTILIASAEQRGSYYLLGAAWRGKPYAPSDKTWLKVWKKELQWLDRSTYWYTVLKEEATRTKNPLMQKIARENLASLQKRHERVHGYEKEFARRNQ